MNEPATTQKREQARRAAKGFGSLVVRMKGQIGDLETQLAAEQEAHRATTARAETAEAEAEEANAALEILFEELERHKQESKAGKNAPPADQPGDANPPPPPGEGTNPEPPSGE